MRILLVLLLLISTKALAIGSHCENHYAMSTEVDGVKMKMTIPGSKISKAGEWSPKSGEPLLSITSAYSIASEWGAANLTRYDSIDIDGIALKKYGCHSSASKEEYWYYLVDYNPVIEGNKLWGGANWLVILMSGEVLVPVKE